MKKRISLILAFALMISLSACGAPPEGFTKNTYNVAKDAVKVMKDFADGSMDAAAAVSELDTLASALEAEIKTLTDATEKSNAADIGITLRSMIYVINRAGGNLSDLELGNIKSTADILERKLKG